MEEELFAVLEDSDEEMNAELSSDVVFLGNQQTISATYTDESGSTENIGGWSIGDTANEMEFQDFAYKLLHKYYSPTVTFSISPNTTLYERGSSITSLSFTINATKKTKLIQDIKIYDGDTLITTITDGVENGGTFTYQYDCNITSDSSLKVSVSDGDTRVNSSTITIRFVARTYYGYIEQGTDVTSDIVTGLQNSTLRTNRSLTYSNINMSNKCITYAYPASYGNLTSILDGNGFSYVNSYTKSNITISDVSYNVYVLTNATTVSGFKQIYS